MTQPTLGTVIVPAIDEKTGEFVFRRNTTQAPAVWMFTGGHIISKDANPERPFDETLRAENAAKRIAEKFLRSTSPMKFVMRKHRGDDIGPIYVYATLADYALLETVYKGATRMSVNRFTFEQAFGLSLPLSHKMAMVETVKFLTL